MLTTLMVYCLPKANITMIFYGLGRHFRPWLEDYCFVVHYCFMSHFLFQYKPLTCLFSSSLQVWLSCCWMSYCRRAMVWALVSLFSLQPTSVRQSSGRPLAQPLSTLAEVWEHILKLCSEKQNESFKGMVQVLWSWSYYSIEVVT